MSDEPLLDAAAAAALAQVKVVTIRAARLAGRLIPAREEPRGQQTEYLYRRSDVLALWPPRESQSNEV